MRSVRTPLVALALGVALIACGEDTAPSVAPTPDAADPAADVADTIRDRFADVYADVFDEQVSPRALENVLRAEQAPVELERRTFLAHLYADRDYAPFLATADGMTPVGSAMLDALRGVEAHGLDPEDYVSEELTARVSDLTQVALAVQALPGVSASPAEIEAIAAIAAAQGATEAAEALRAGLSADDDELADLRRAHEVAVDVRRVAAGSAALVEAMLADAVLAYAFDQRNFNTSWVDEDLGDDERHALIAERSRETFEGMAALTDAAGAEAYFGTLQPHHPQYNLLLAERARYAEIVANGGWETIEPRHIERGSSGDTVSAVQRRLAAEGYFDGEIDGQFGETLEEAVRAYQTTHQMEVTGESSRGFWNSLNISAEQRLAQIELTMQRWRENRIGDDPYYVHVNIPDMHAEVWRDGQREMRFRIVVGNTVQVCDPQTNRLTYANATPIQSATMTYVVLNPMWNVPRRIVEEELLPSLAENPLYFEEMGFERYTTSGGIEIVRQLPGPENPLGRVKFMFPNPHNTYMHDTSRPQYFRYPVRAFSHGCMRVQDPLDLLEYILTQDGQWDQARIDRIYERGEETSVTLRTPIPVHIEYYVVHVDDEGRANFLADIYRYDRDRLEPPSAASLRCEPEQAGPRLVLGEGDVVLYENDAGDRYTAEQWSYVQAGGTLERLEDGTFANPPVQAIEGSGEGAPAVGLPGIDQEPSEDGTIQGDIGP